MPFTIHPKVDQDKAIGILEGLGVFGAVKKGKDTLRLYKRKSKRIDPKTGREVSFSPEEQMTPEIRKRLERMGWMVVHSSAYAWTRTFPN